MQLGCSFFQALAGEFSSHDYGRVGVEEWFRPIVAPGDPLGPYGTATSYVARSVMIDMEPKVCFGALGAGVVLCHAVRGLLLPCGCLRLWKEHALAGPRIHMHSRRW